jgi:hypothetical protein
MKRIALVALALGVAVQAGAPLLPVLIVIIALFVAAVGPEPPPH